MPFFFALLYLLVCIEERVHLFFESIEELEPSGIMKALGYCFLETLADVFIMVILMAIGGLIWHLLALLIIY